MLVIKLLTLLGSISIVASTASVAIACTDKVPTATSNNNLDSDNLDENDDMNDGSKGTEIKNEKSKEEKTEGSNDLNNGLGDSKVTEQRDQNKGNSEAPKESETVTKPSESDSSTQGDTTSSGSRETNSSVSSSSSSSNIDNLDMEEHNTVQ
ncbi:lipoprotein [Mycoplasma mycoides]|uniref:lipoprotein n=1 Tax=Mycoplasma mycoides TaxID=2102 RepID=UPI0027361C2E|nr:lipoprotein [Mycoplasma mycoides]MDP4040022.1 lipoprotein [Mycoplasma mycoides]MDP4041014.1 lipoprotein [Mycoplasma mycoides]MDP4041783.1 lipoprotein [Mycoplasma mycoides]MDP4043440.1 lipoprotein [Mycoplasma mycoides]MDP4044307.1 lipoprotein [Mycoplasma mycoides]